MSENLDLVRAIYADWEHGDFHSTDWAHPDIEFVIIGGPTPARYHGLPGMARGMREFLTVWEEYRIEAEEYRELDGERILVLTRDSGRGRTSGVETVEERAHAIHLENGRVTRIATYWDRGRALADLGSEEGGVT
jgi:ketosteroid isomerase-like protein